MIVKHKLKGIHTKGTEIFGDTGESGYSKKDSFTNKLISEVIIRLNNKQNIFTILYLILGRSIMKIFYIFFK